MKKTLTLFVAFFVITFISANIAQASELFDRGLQADISKPELVAGIGLVTCGNGTGDECRFCDLVVVAKKVLDFLVMATALVATILFINAGILYMFSAGNPGNVAKAHRIFVSAFIGFVVVLTAWLVVSLIMAWFYTGSPLSGVPGIGSDWETMICP